MTAISETYVYMDELQDQRFTEVRDLVRHALIFLMVSIIFYLPIASIPLPIFKFYSSQRLLFLIMSYALIYNVAMQGKHRLKVERMWFLIFLAGFFISFFIGVYMHGYDFITKNAGGLRPDRTFTGMMLYFVFIVTFRGHRNLERLYWALAIVGFAVILSVRLKLTSGVSGYIMDASYEHDTYVAKEYISKGLYYIRETFLTLDTNNYGGIVATILLIGVYQLSLNTLGRKQKLFLIALIFISTWSLIATLSLVSIIKTIATLCLFYWLKVDKLKPQYLFYLTMGIVVVIVLGSYFPNTFLGHLLIQRFEKVWINLPTLLTYSHNNYITDNFSSRIVMAIDAITRMHSPLWGTGGVALKYNVATGNHIDWVNWLYMYGLFTFIPLVCWQGFLLRSLLWIRKKTKQTGDAYFDQNYQLKIIIAIVILIGTWIEMLNSPLFLVFWAWISIVSAASAQFHYDYNKYLKEHRIKNMTTEQAE